MRNFSFLTAIALTWGCTPPGTPGKAELTAAPNPVQFGQVAVDQTATKQVVIKNIGTAEVTVTSSIAASSFIVPAGNLTIAAGGSTTVTLRFRPTRIATTSEDWVLAERGQAPLLKLTLRGEGVAPCTDADSDGAQANCTTGTDCDDTNPAVHPGAIERCNGGIDDDCDPATVEVCAVDGGRDAGPADAGPRDAGPLDAGPCTCTDDPTDCLGLNACYRDAGAAVCTTFDQPDLTSCRRSAVDGGIGVCLRASCVECFNASDCIALNASATTCDFVSCTNNRCDSVRRHDNTAWRVNPPMSPEILVSPGATPIKAMWDGQNFAVALTTLDGGAVVKRLTPAGIILDPVGYRLSPRVKDIAFSGDRFLQVTQEPANGGAQPWAYIAGSYLSYDGGANSAPTPLIWDTTRVNGHFVAPSVAGSSQGSFMVVAGASQYSWVKWRQFPGDRKSTRLNSSHG